MPFSDSELSDLVYDELQGDSDSEPEYAPTRSQARKQPAPPQEYRLQQALKPPRATTYTSRALYGVYSLPYQFPLLELSFLFSEAIMGSTVDLSPSYQRG